MAVEWLLPVAKELYRNRDAAFSTWDEIISKIFGPKSRIAVVGPGGIGKTVLLDHMTGRALLPKYVPPARSRKAEKGGAKSLGNRLALVVAPGQGGPKVDAFNSMFDSNNPVDGVVFVAGSGFVTLRSTLAVERNIAAGLDTVDKWRELNMNPELDYLKDVTSILRATKAKSRKPRWLLVAATKIDLHYSEIETTKIYYSPHGKSKFTQQLNDLRAHVGTDNFEWEAVPVCSQLDDFVWGEEIVKSQLDTAARDHYLAQMIKRMGELCQA